MNALNGKVQVVDVNLIGRVVWYSPSMSPDIVTDADVYDQEGDLLLVYTGMRYKLIAVQQVERSVSPRNHSGIDLQDVFYTEYEQEINHD